MKTVAPALKHAFKGNDVTIFAYGVTGTGKTHTMRGGKKVVDRGIIPRLLQAIFRRKKELEKKSEDTKVSVTMSYYEIYNDKVYDLFEAPEKRSAAGLPLREFEKKTIVVGLSEKEVTSPAMFEGLYDQANNNRSTSATKLNAHSSRSHAVTCVKVTIEDGEGVREARISAIDLAGSEDNRRAGNDKERMLESQSINKSLFVLAQCVDAIAKKASRIPFRDSKMTRILSLGQNNSMTIMILNLAPTKAYHQDTLSSLTVASRAKTIETKEVETETYVKPVATKPVNLSTAARVPLRTIPQATAPRPQATSNIKKPAAPLKVRPTVSTNRPTAPPATGKLTILEEKLQKLESTHAQQLAELKAQLDSQLNENKVSQAKIIEKLEQADVQREARMYCHLAKQDRHRGDLEGAIQNYRTALLYVPEHPKILARIENLEALLAGKGAGKSEKKEKKQKVTEKESDENVRANSVMPATPPPAKPAKKHAKLTIFRDDNSPPPASTRSVSVAPQAAQQTPRTSALLSLLNAPSLPAISKLKGIGAKRAEKLYAVLTDENGGPPLRTLEDVVKLPGLGAKIVETMRNGMVVGPVGGVGEGKENVDPLPEVSLKVKKLSADEPVKTKKAVLGVSTKKPLLPKTLFDEDVSKKRTRTTGKDAFRAKWCFQDEGEESEYVASEVEADASYCDSEEEGRRRKRRAGGAVSRGISVR